MHYLPYKTGSIQGMKDQVHQNLLNTSQPDKQEHESVPNEQLNSNSIVITKYVTRRSPDPCQA